LKYGKRLKRDEDTRELSLLDFLRCIAQTGVKIVYFLLMTKILRLILLPRIWN